MKTTKDLRVGDVIIVKTGCKYFDNIKKSEQTISGIYNIGKQFEVSFISGLVCKFAQNTQHIIK